MKVYQKILFGLGILLLVLLHRFLFQSKEGFSDNSSKYNKLRDRLTKELGTYCKISEFIRVEYSKMVKSFDPKSGADPPPDLETMYKSVYSCTDKSANSRASCSSPNTTMEILGCDTYMKLPEWSTNSTPVLALMKIKKDFPERLVRESEWFISTIKQLNESLALGSNPPTSVPSDAEMNAMKEGFTGPTCSPEAAEYQQSQKLRDEAAKCSIPSVSSEIERVNALLDSSEVKSVLSKLDKVFSDMKKLKTDLEKANNGELYDWQKPPPTKNFPKYKGGDRSSAFVFSLQQNQL